MEKLKIGLVADEAFDLPQEIIEKYKIGVAKFKIDLQNLTDFSGNIYQKMRKAEEENIQSTVKTSQPSINDFLIVFREKFKEFEEIICITISSKLSGTYNSAVQAKKFLEKEMQDKVHIIDSLNASGGEGLVAIRAIDLIREELKINDIVEKLRNDLLRIKLLGMYKSPKWLESSGRIPTLASSIIKKAEKISVRPIFGIKSGKLKVVGIKRNMKDVSSALFEEFEKATQRTREKGTKIAIAINHADNIEQAEKLKKSILSLKNTDVSFITLVCIPLGGHIGPGSLVLSWQE
jgi:DegV family protein with EDD domain